VRSQRDIASLERLEMISFGRMHVGWRLAIAGMAVLLGLASLAGYTLLQMRKDALAAHDARIKGLVEVSKGIIGNYQKLELERKLTREDAQLQAKEALRSPRFGNNDYYFLYDYDGRALMVAGNPKIEGQVLLDKTDAAGFKMWEALVARGKSGQGYFDYVFPRAGDTESTPKRGYVIGIPEWQWIVGTGVYIDDVDEALKRTALGYGLITLFVLAIVAAVAYLASHKLVAQFQGELRDSQGNAHHYLALFSDVTALKAHQSQLEHMAYFDALTSLPNRVLLADRLHQAIAQAKRRGQILAVAYLDLDGFKVINDSHGHHIGDRLLVILANRMHQVLRESDTFARLGGDEFVAVLPDLEDADDSMTMLTRLLAVAAQPAHVGDLVLQVSASLGVTFYPQSEDVDADQLLRQSDHAMYQAKLAGKNRYHVFDAEHDRSLRSHHESLAHIRRALMAREFVLHFQPKVNMRTGEVIGAEALIRWQHPERGLLPPSVFLPVVENHALAVDIGEWVIDTALDQMEIWRDGGLNIPVSVNVSARHLQQPDFALRLREMLAAHSSIRPGDLAIEVLETSALDDVTQVSQLIKDCREIGVSFSLDDFGTGYSSLTYLKRLSVSQLKIDRSFVRDMLDDPDDLAILEGILGLSSAFRRQVIAEGVETVEQGTMLLQLGCELAQGFVIARPMPADSLPDWVASWRPDSSWIDRLPISRDELQVLFAKTEHRAWILALEKHINGEQDLPPQIDARQCRFGVWLGGEGMARYGTQSVFRSIDSLHRKIHQLADQLLVLHSQGRKPEAIAGLVELHIQKKALLEQLHLLVQKDRHPAYRLTAVV
jgi:diguanylate cyclase (GGDEF)-like protein